MRDFPVPVVAFGAGSQAEPEAVDYLPLPHEMTTFAMPVYNLEADPQILAAACDMIENLRDEMQAGSNACIELGGLPGEVVELINQAMGQGEVSVLVREPHGHGKMAAHEVDARWNAPLPLAGEGADDPLRERYFNPLHIQETVFAGIWRVQEISAQGVVMRDALHACAIPPEVQQSALSVADGNITAPPLHQGIMNAPAILNELLDRSRHYQAGQAAHVLNLSLLPMSPEDLQYLFEAFGTGTVSILSRGYGNCRITSTRLANVWWVQYFNSMDAIILNTIEVVDMPEVALAADDDYQDSIARLGEWLAVMREE